MRVPDAALTQKTPYQAADRLPSEETISRPQLLQAEDFLHSSRVSQLASKLHGHWNGASSTDKGGVTTLLLP